jgi:hypothetical protein
MSNTVEELTRAVHGLHAIIVGTAEDGLELGVPTGSSADAVEQSVEWLKRLGLQEDFSFESDIIKRIEDSY